MTMNNIMKNVCFLKLTNLHTEHVFATELKTKDEAIRKAWTILKTEEINPGTVFMIKDCHDKQIWFGSSWDMGLYFHENPSQNTTHKEESDLRQWNSHRLFHIPPPRL